MQKFETLPGVRKVTENLLDGSTVLEFILAEEPVLSTVVNALTETGARILNLQKREPTLEDVFVELVGSSMHDVERGDGEKP